VVLFGTDQALTERARRLLTMLGLQHVRVGDLQEKYTFAGEIGFAFQPDAQSLRMLDEHGIPDESQQQLLLYTVSLLTGSRALYPVVGAPQALEALAQKYRAKIYWQKNGSALTKTADTQQWEDYLLQFDLLHDAFFAMLMTLQVMTARQLSLRQLLGEAPAVHRTHLDVACNRREKSRVLRAVAEEAHSPDLTDGVRIQHEGGWATILSGAQGDSLRVFGEAASVEFAEELCNSYAQKIRAFQNDGKNNDQEIVGKTQTGLDTRKGVGI